MPQLTSDVLGITYIHIQRNVYFLNVQFVDFGKLTQSPNRQPNQ